MWRFRACSGPVVWDSGQPTASRRRGITQWHAAPPEGEGSNRRSRRTPSDRPKPDAARDEQNADDRLDPAMRGERQQAGKAMRAAMSLT